MGREENNPTKLEGPCRLHAGAWPSSHGMRSLALAEGHEGGWAPFLYLLLTKVLSLEHECVRSHLRLKTLQK